MSNPSGRARSRIYILNALAAPLVAYAFAKGWIGELEVTLYGAEAAVTFTLAGLNVPRPPELPKWLPTPSTTQQPPEEST